VRSRAALARLFAVLMLLFCAGLVAGCGDDDGEEEATTAPDVAAQEEDYDITGEWSGKLRQENLAPFRVTATIGDLKDPKQNTVSYTVIDCSGNWTYEGRDGAAFTFREVINSGKGGSCKGVGRVSLTPFAPDGVDYVFRGGGVESYGVLRRGD
jgi:hypothetical protein